MSKTASREYDSTMNGRGVAASGSVTATRDRNLRQRSAFCLIGMEDCNHDLGLSSRQVTAWTSSKAIIASPVAVRLIAPAQVRSFKGFRVGDEVGVRGGVGHGHCPRPLTLFPVAGH